MIDVYSEEELQKKLADLRRDNEYLKGSLDSLLESLTKDDQLHLPWIGNLGHWYWYVPENIVEFNEAKITAIGYRRDEIEGDVDYQFFTDKLHPDDYEPVMENMRQHMMGNTEAYEVSYRIQHKDGSYRWYYDRGTVTKRTETGGPIMLAGIVFDISEQKAKEAELEDLVEQLKRLATIDDLTGAYNRRAIQEKLETELERSRRYNRPLTITFVDLDGFKTINDTYGHNIGDEILKGVTHVLHDNLRANDIVGRWGGDEFIILSPETSMQEATAMAKRISKAICSHDHTHGIRMSASIGVSECAPSDNIYLVINRVDKLMYKGKQEGGNSVINHF